jgi:RNA polymerase sigma factor for flagellar operon FliA
MERGGLCEIAVDECHSRKWGHLQQIDRDHPAARADLARRDLRPASRRRAQVDDDLPRTEKVILRKLEQQFGRAPQESEIAGEMGVSLTEYQEMLGKVRGTQLVYLEDMSGDDGSDDYLDRHVADSDANPLLMLQDQRMREALVAAIKHLPEREQYVMSMYYEHDMNLKEIAAVLGVTESRVCQLHSQSIARLRVKLREW